MMNQLFFAIVMFMEDIRVAIKSIYSWLMILLLGSRATKYISMTAVFPPNRQLFEVFNDHPPYRVDDIIEVLSEIVVYPAHGGPKKIIKIHVNELEMDGQIMHRGDYFTFPIPTK